MHKKNDDNNNDNNNDLNVDNNVDVDTNSDSEINAAKIENKYTVRRDWKGQTNYYPGHDFEPYRPNDLPEDAQCKWDQQLQKRKDEIEKRLVDIFLKKGNVKRVPYSGRQRWSFPCPEKGCQFNSVDLGKHLTRKHKWNDETVKLQTTYFHNIYQYSTRVTTYNHAKPCICFKCKFVVDRIDSHMSLKHFKRGSNEFVEHVMQYREKSSTLLFRTDSFEESAIHNIAPKFKEIAKFRVGQVDPNDQNEPANEERSPTYPAKSSSSKSQASNSSVKSVEERSQTNPNLIPKSSSSECQTSSLSSKLVEQSSTSSKPGPSGYSKQPGKFDLRGKFEAPKKETFKILLQNKQEITAAFRKKYKVATEDFRYFYDSSKKLLNDFERYLYINLHHTKGQAEQYKSNVADIWRCVDDEMAIFPRNFLSNTCLIEDNFYIPTRANLEKQMKLPKHERGHYIQASTIKSKLCAVSVLCRFLGNRSIFINLKRTDLVYIQAKVSELCSALKPAIDQRFKVMSKFKSENLLTVTSFQSYGSSEHIKYINQFLKKSAAKETKGVTLTKQRAIDVRDYLMVSLSYFNCLRASNLFNISIEDFTNIKKHDEIQDAWVLTNEEFKVSMIYGAKIILLDDILYEQVKSFIKLYRPLITDDKGKSDFQRYLFTSSRIPTNKPLGVKMNHFAISNTLTSSFKKAKVSHKVISHFTHKENKRS